MNIDRHIDSFMAALNRIDERNKKLREGRCEPYRGEVDEEFRPIDTKGKLFLPGERTCRKKDCVNPSHIIPSIELERIDISYRTGLVTRFEDLERELR